MHLIKPGLRHQDLEGIYLPSFIFSCKLKKLCRVDFFVFESWQTAEDVMVLPCDFGRFLTLFPLKRPVRREKGGRPSMTSSRDVTASPLYNHKLEQETIRTG
jgi:hypothetical protein